MFQDDYPELEGLVVDVPDGKEYSPPVTKGRVVGVNYHVGITIVNDDDPTQELACLNAKLHMNRGNGRWKDTRAYDIIFFQTIAQLQTGYFDAMETDNLAFGGSSVNGFGSMTCAFGS